MTSRMFQRRSQYLAQAIEACSTAWELRAFFRETLHLEVLSSRLSAYLGIRSVLAVVRDKTYGHLYLKHFDPISCAEASDEPTGPDDVELRLAPFSSAERQELDQELRFVNGTLDQHWPQSWEYVRLARRSDVLRRDAGQL